MDVSFVYGHYPLFLSVFYSASKAMYRNVMI